jgi:uncharacterized protein (PEP-CTERM system associated)
VHSDLHYNVKHYRIIALVLLYCLPSLCIAGEIEIQTAVTSTVYVYETKEEEITAQSKQAIVVVPSVLASYSSKRLLTSLAAEHTKVEQKSDIENADKNYTDYKYNGTLTLIPNALNIVIDGQQDYRILDQQQDFIADRVLAIGGLTKLNNNSVSVDFTIPNPKYFGLAIRSSYSNTKTKESIDDNTNVNGSSGLNNGNTVVSMQLYQSKNARNYSFNFSAQYNDTKRTGLENFKSSQAQGLIGLPFPLNISFILVGNVEYYDDNQIVYQGTDIGSESYGAGIEWQPRNGKVLKLTYNQLNEGEEDNKTNFLGVNLDWAFSTRTALKFDYSERFYGDAYSLNFDHALKSIRSSITYKEQVTSFARQEFTNSTGLFVCQLGSTDLVDCFQPDSTNYQLQAGEEFRTLSEIGIDISEEIIFSKSGQLNISYQKRRIKASVFASYRKTESLESNKTRTNSDIRLNLSYTLSKKSSLNFSTAMTRSLYDNDATPDNIIKVNLDLKRTFGGNLQFTSGLGVIYRDSVVEDRNIENHVLTIGMNYTF